MLAALSLLALANGAYAETNVIYGTGADVTQTSPPGAVAHEQVLIIENDRFGNQRVLSIGGPGRVAVGPQPCVREKPIENMDCSGEDLRGVRWNDARLSSGRFDGADLRGASLRGAEARLDQAQLINCDFIDANLSDSSLRGAEIVNTGFTDSNLTRTDLQGARLTNVDFDTARLSDATWLDGQRCSDDSTSACQR
jgi:uncharacterized protein YjbI with pentapeptide repeats